MSARAVGDAAWRRALDAGLAPGLGERLILEVSEASAMLLPEVVARFMEAMRPEGGCLALDGLGAGLIPFRHLRGSSFALGKVDRRLVAGIERSPDTRALAVAPVSVARQVEMVAAAEGMETQGEARHLRARGGDRLQGCRLGRPQATPPLRPGRRASCRRPSFGQPTGGRASPVAARGIAD